MKPKKLKITGLNSFIEEQVIDFEKLTSRGLFGIFGPTGSGKSTILDAITIAMYGKIARETREFINSNTDVVSVSYEFEIGKGGERKTYIVERSIKRDAKSGGYDTKLARLREATKDGYNILGEGPNSVKDNIIKIVGLTVEDFTRSVVLPQGKFNEFLKLTGQDRRNMLERIFNLEEFGNKLVKKIRFMKNEIQQLSDRLEGELKRYEGVSEEAYKAIENELKELIAQEKALKEEKKKLDDQYQASKGIWDKQEELKRYELRKAELDSQLSDIESKISLLKKAQGAAAVKPFVDAVNETKSKIEKNDTELVRLNAILKNLEESLVKTEAEYSRALERKDKEIPVLIEREAKLNQAVVIEGEVEKLQTELEALRKDFEENRDSINKLSAELGKIMESRDSAAARLNEIEDRIGHIKTVPDYKEKVQKAYDIEKEYLRLSKDSEDRKVKIKNLTTDIDKKKSEYTAVIYKKDEISKEMDAALSRQKALEESFPGDSSTLIKKKSELDLVRLKMKETLEDSSKKAGLEKELSEVSARREEARADLDNTVSALILKKTELESVRQEIEKIRIRDMANILAADIHEDEPCPVCGSIHHPNPAGKVESSELDQRKEFEKNLNAEIEKFQADLNSLQTKFSKYNAEFELKETEIGKVNEKLDGIDVETMKTGAELLRAEFESLDLKIRKWNDEKKEVETLISDLKDKKGGVDAGEARLAEGLSKDQMLLQSFESELSAITQKYDEAKAAYETSKSELGIDDIGSRLLEINKNEREIASLQGEESALKKKKESFDKLKDELEGKINELRLKKAQIEQSGKEKSGYIKEQKAKALELSENRNPKEYMAEVKNAISSIKGTEELLKKRLDSEKNEKQQMQDKKLGAAENGRTLDNLLDSQQTRLDGALKENGFEDAMSAVSSILDKNKITSMESEIKKYQDECSFVDKNMEKIKSSLEGKSIDDESWNVIQGSLKNINENLGAKAMEIGAKNQNLKDMEASIGAVKELGSRKKQVDHKLDLLRDLDKLVQGNAFVEFVATSQLKYIAAEASKRLKEITRGRYALETDSTGNFIMRDDFNGGTRRATDTLSGGETFLTSLSLALALSSQIQLKGSAPLEFFFLDEGFGTLDSELLETVMSSLERLHSDRLCVGIISHVEELKNRVPVKLVVSPAKPGSGGTKVQIEYS